VAYCLGEGGIAAADLDCVVFYDKPILTFDRLLLSYLTVAPRGLRSWLAAMPVWLGKKLHVPKVIRQTLGFEGDVLFTEHHEAHAASAFYPSPFREAAILTIDGVGEWATASYGYGWGRELYLLKEMHFPDSLGLLYSAFTYFAGFRVNSGEYKLMGLAPYGEPVYRDVILRELVDVKEDGSIRLNLSYFDFVGGLRMTNGRFASLFGGPPREPETMITKREMDLAASIQAVTEEIVLRMARHVHRETKQSNLCLAGGVALNCVANGRILKEGPFERLWIQPAAGDAGGALGAALFVWYQLLENPRRPDPMDMQSGSLLGPSFTTEEIRAFLEREGAVYEVYEDEEELLDTVSDALAAEQVVGWFQGRMEFGPRALGSRSILGDARSDRMQSKMNLKIKFRESFRPFAPSVLAERAEEFFELKNGCVSPYMLLVAPIQESKRIAAAPQEKPLFGLDLLKVRRSCVPGITHVDYSSRVQTVDEKRHGRYYRLLKRFEAKTGCPLVINTSFNVRGEPIVCTPADAYRCFMATNMDMLVMENVVLRKERQPKAKVHETDEYLARFALD